MIILNQFITQSYCIICQPSTYHNVLFCAITFNQSDCFISDPMITFNQIILLQRSFDLKQIQEENYKSCLFETSQRDSFINWLILMSHCSKQSNLAIIVFQSFNDVQICRQIVNSFWCVETTDNRIIVQTCPPLKFEFPAIEFQLKINK